MIDSIKTALSLIKYRPRNYNIDMCHVLRDHSDSKVKCILNRAHALKQDIAANGLTENLRNRGEHILRDADTIYTVDFSYYSTYTDKVSSVCGNVVQNRYFQMPEVYAQLEQAVEVVQNVIS